MKTLDEPGCETPIVRAGRILHAVAVILATALFILAFALSASARQVTIRVGDNYMYPNDVHIFAEDGVTFLNEGSYITEIHFGENCQYDVEMDQKYARQSPWPALLAPGEAETWEFPEAPGTVLHLLSSVRCRSAVGTITIHGRAESFRTIIPAGATVHSSELGSGGVLTFNNLAILGTLVLDGDTQLTVKGTGMPSPQLESFLLTGSIVCDLKPPAVPGAAGLNGYDLAMTINGVANMGGSIDLSGTQGAGGAAGADAGGPACSERRYPSPNCTGTCTFYDDDQCKAGCDVCDPGWRLPENCSNPDDPGHPCTCCIDQTLANGWDGGNGGTGGKGGNGGALKLVHKGELYNSLPRVISNGGDGGPGGDGGAGSGGCDEYKKCGKKTAAAIPGRGGAAGTAGIGGSGGTIRITTTGTVKDDYLPERSARAQANGGTGGAGATAGGTPDWRKTPGFSSASGGRGGKGGLIVVNAGCSYLHGSVLSANGGNGGRSPYQVYASTFGGVPGAPGGNGGQIAVQAGHFDSFNVPHAFGGNGSKGGVCGQRSFREWTGPFGGDGGTGGMGGSVKITASVNEQDPQWVWVRGGSGGEGGDGPIVGTAGADGADGTYTPGTAGNQNAQVDVVADGSAAPGEILEYTLMVNAGSTPLTNVVVSVPIPADTIYVSASGNRHTREGNLIKWQVGDLEACQGETLTMRVRVDPACPLGSVITCRATVSSDGQPDVESTAVQTVVEPSTDDEIDPENILGNGGNQLFAGEPVNPATGNFLYSRELFSFPGKGLPIRFIATYNALDNATFGPLGAGWTHTFNVGLSLDSSAVVGIKWADGHKDSFQRGEGIYVPVKSYTSVVVSDTSSSGYQAALPDGTKYIFTLYGVLQKIEDRNGNAITLAYEDKNNPYLLTSVTDTSGRVIKFAYSNGLIKSISGPLTKVLFSYSLKNDLIAITDGLGHKRRFTYDRRHRITGLIDALDRTVFTNAYDHLGRVIEQKNALKQVTSYAYEETSTGRQTAVTSPAGNAVLHIFDRNYNLIKVVDGEGCEAAFSYNEQGRCTQATDKKGASLTKAYDMNGNSLQLTDRLGNTTQAEYDEINKATTIKDPLGNTTTAAYDGKGNRLAIADPLAVTAQYAYNSAGQQTGMVNPSGLTLSMGYNAAGLPKTISNSMGSMTSLEYDAAGRPTALSTDDGSLRIQVDYDANGNPVTVTDPMGFKTTLVYDADDNLVTRTFVPLNASFKYQYDVLNRVTKITDPGNGETSYTYDADGNVASVTDPDGIKIRFEHDKRNRLTAVRHPGGGVTSYGYDNNGNRTSVTDPGGRIWQFTYDAENHPVEVIDPAGRKVTQTFDASGHLTARADELGRVTSVEFDAAGRIARKTLPDGSKLRHTYNGSGKRTRSTDELGHAWSFAYDKAEHLAKAVDPEGKSTQMVSDSMGRLTQRIDRSGETVDYAYDADSRIVTMTLSGKETIQFTYDAAGRVQSATSPSGTLARTYDKMGRLLTLTDEKGKVLRYAYTKAGRVASVTYPGGHKVAYTYDAAGRLSTVTDWFGYVTTYHYDKMNRVVGTDLPNGTKTIRVYDVSGRLSSLKHLDSGGDVIAAYTFIYDGGGQIAKATRNEPAPTSLPSFEGRYSYSESNRLTTGTSGGKAASYGFDDNGNMILKKVGAAQTTYGYDSLNRLTAVRKGAATTLYEYDALGNRTAKTHNGVETRYLANGSTPLFRYSVAGTPELYFIHGGSLLYSLDDAGNLYVYHTDERGSVTAVTDSGQQVVQALSYDPYGKILSKSGSFNGEFCYLGTHGVQTDENGLVFMKARYYDPGIMRFLGEDPMGPATALNLYPYAGGNPISRMDPSGLKDQDALGQSTTSQPTAQTGEAPELPTWTAPFDVVISWLGLTLTPAQEQAFKVALRNFDVVHDRTTDVFYLIPKDITKLKAPIPLSTFEPLSKKVMGYTGKVFTGLDIGINVYNGGKATYNYFKKHGAGHFIKDLANGDVDAWMVIHENAMGVNSTVLGRSKNPAVLIISAELTTIDYLVDNWGVEIVAKEYSRDAEDEYLENKAGLEGRLKGMTMAQEFEDELKKVNADLRDFTGSFHGDNFNDGLNGCSLD